MNKFSNYMDKPAGSVSTFAWNPTKLGAIGGVVVGSLQSLPSQLNEDTGQINNPGIGARAFNIIKNAGIGAGLGYGANKANQYIRSGALDDVIDPLKNRVGGLRDSLHTRAQPILNKLPEVQVSIKKKVPYVDPYEGIDIPEFR